MPNLLIQISDHTIRCSLSDISEAHTIWVDGHEYTSTPRLSSVYDYLRNRQTDRLIGVELQLGAQARSRLLDRFSSFHQFVEPATGFWATRFLFPDVTMWPNSELIVSSWDQILSDNPFFSQEGNILLVLQIDHLAEADRDRIAELCKHERIKDI